MIDTKDKILKEAIRQINQKGLIKVGVRDIARALDISPGNMSYHFPKKDDLVMALLRTYSASNSEFYEEYLTSDPSLGRLLAFFRSLFNNQYSHRGVLVGQEEVSRIMTNSSDFDYSELEQRRKRSIANMLRELSGTGHLMLTEDDIQFLVDFISLFGRFWILEAFISFPKKKKNEVIDHYIGLLQKQLTLFATAKGLASMT